MQIILNKVHSKGQRKCLINKKWENKLMSILTKSIEEGEKLNKKNKISRRRIGEWLKLFHNSI